MESVIGCRLPNVNSTCLKQLNAAVQSVLKANMHACKHLFQKVSLYLNIFWWKMMRLTLLLIPNISPRVWHTSGRSQYNLSQSVRPSVRPSVIAHLFKSCLPTLHVLWIRKHLKISRFKSISKTKLVCTHRRTNAVQHPSMANFLHYSPPSYDSSYSSTAS